MRIKIRDRQWVNITFGGFIKEERGWWEPPRIYINFLWWHVSINLPLPYKVPITAPTEHPRIFDVVGERWTWNGLGIVHASNEALTWKTPAELDEYNARRRAARGVSSP